MGTKSNPGSFNCYGAALPDETIFTTLARDPAMPATIGFWMGERARLGKNVDPEDLDRLLEAGRVAEDAKDWREANLDPHGDGIPTWKLPRPEPEPGEDRPIRMNPASQYERARLDPLYSLMPKVIVGLNQIADDMARVINQTAWPNKRKDQMHAFGDRIKGFAREIGDAVGPGDFTVDFSGINQTDETDDQRVVRVGDLGGGELEAIRTAEPSDRSKGLDHLMEDEPQMLSRTRIEEFLDYATVYGDWDENTPNGKTHNLSGEPMNDYRRVAIVTYKKVLGLLSEDYLLATPQAVIGEPEGEGVRLNIQWLLGLVRRLRAAPDLNEPRRVAEELELATGTKTFAFTKPYEGDYVEVPIPTEEPKAESDMVDLAEVPESEVPPHRFTYFSKFGRYAYARGLEVAPPHLPRALDAMTKDGWFLLAIFGATDSQHVGFIFERREDTDTPVDLLTPLRRAVEEAGALLQPAEDDVWIEQALGRHYDNTRIAMREAIDRGRMLQATDLPATGQEALPTFLATLPAETRVEVMLLLLESRGENCHRYAMSVLAAEHVEHSTDGHGGYYPILRDLPNDKLGRIAARLEAAYRDDCSSETGGCTGYGRQMEP